MLLAALFLAPAYAPDPSRWTEIPLPSKAEAANRAVWEYAANYSKIDWGVEPIGGRVKAHPTKEGSTLSPDTPAFLPRTYGATAQRVPDGWLVGANHGEWGGSLTWFSPNGKRHRKVSDDQIVAFFNLPSGLYAIMGLAHLGISEGSVVHLVQAPEGKEWTATKAADLPAAPYAVAVRPDGAALIVLSNGLAEFSAGRSVRNLLNDAPWWGLYPNSAALSADEGRLYVGMRQFVAEIDLRTSALRFLVPSRTYLNRLDRDTERSVRAMHRG